MFFPHTPFSAFEVGEISPSADGDEGAALDPQPFAKGWTENLQFAARKLKCFSTS